MSLIRFNITGAIPPPANPAEKAWFEGLISKLRILKSHCVIINEDKPNAEHITNFTYHICHHDEVGASCEPEQEI